MKYIINYHKFMLRQETRWSDLPGYVSPKYNMQLKEEIFCMNQNTLKVL